jgi:hypothetical protein
VSWSLNCVWRGRDGRGCGRGAGGWLVMRGLGESRDREVGRGSAEAKDEGWE